MLLTNIPALEPPKLEPISISIKQEQPEKPKPVEYIIKDGETLTSIATATHSTVDRLFDKNTAITNPDVIKPGDKLVIPTAEEQLTDRPMPAATIVGVTNHTASPGTTSPPTRGASVVPRGAIAGNTYTPRNCTWYAKNRRPDLPNNLGNADTWVARAAAQGIPTGSTPRAGAIGQRGMHVVYIERVNGDGTVYLSEMNYDYNGGFRYRTAPASSFQYIY